MESGALLFQSNLPKFIHLFATNMELWPCVCLRLFHFPYFSLTLLHEKTVTLGPKIFLISNTEAAMYTNSDFFPKFVFFAPQHLANGGREG